ncbi:MAG: Serine kinase of the HPr protein regulates carbohydrate metabolism [Labilithrix sp.]|nr:Serine kinase of the HPr protein regulates carbohydrate metabolism [Labilithrix sp.]
MSAAHVEWLARYEEDEDVLFRIGRSGDTLIAEWMGLVTVTSDARGEVVTTTVAEGADPEDVEKIRRGGAMLLVRHLQGKLALHGAAVAFGAEAIVLLGRSGQGKSTLAASLCAAGASLLADDAVAIDSAGASFVVVPSEVKHWLDAPARAALAGGAAPPDDRGKAAIATARPAAGAARLCAFVELAFVEEDAPAKLVRLAPGIAAMATLVPQAVRFAVDDPRLQRAELDALGRLVDAVPVYRLERPRSLERLGAAHPLLLSLTGRGLEEPMERSP